MADLTAFLAARLDEDRAVAREAAGLTECWVAEEPAIGVVLVDGEPLIEGHITGLTAHIARHDPARVLRDVEAKRAILARYQDCLARMEDPDYPQGVARDQAREYEDFVLLNLAAAWSDHPDYDQDWEP